MSVKTEKTESGWCVIAPNGNAIMIEHASGGYPYANPSPGQVTIWADGAEAIKYCDIMNRSGEAGSYHAVRCTRTIAVDLTTDA